ncbi:MAG: ABC transporter permease [Gemmatirosa sp.]
MISFDGSTPPRVDERARTARVLDELTAAALVPQPAGGALLDDDDFLVSDETLDIAPAESPLRRYLKYQVRDFVQQRAVWLLAIGMIGVYFFWYNYDPAAVAERMREGGDSEPRRWKEFVTALTGGFSAIAAVFSVHGLVSGERERGLQRFLFAKPVARVPYYLQKLAVAFTGTMLLTVVVGGLFGAAFGRVVPIDTFLMVGTALFASVGGLTFLLSTLVRFEGGLALIGTLGVIPLRELAQRGDGWAWLGALRYLLPPIERFGPLVDAGLPGDPVRAMLWAVAYGAACVAAGIVVLRRRSILT